MLVVSCIANYRVVRLRFSGDVMAMIMCVSYFHSCLFLAKSNSNAANNFKIINNKRVQKINY